MTVLGGVAVSDFRNRKRSAAFNFPVQCGVMIDDGF